MMSKAFTAKVQISSKQDNTSGPVAVVFQPDYAQGRNKEWAEATPALALSMTVKPELAEQLAQGQRFTLTFTPEDEDGEQESQDQARL